MKTQRRRGFTIIELLVVVGVVAVLMAILLPSLATGRDRARGVQCLSNLRQLGLAQTMYAGDFKGRVIPAAYTSARIVGDGPPIYWWGGLDESGVDHTRGFVWPYLQSELRAGGLFECPNQPWGSYEPQGQENAVTSTYGYNGYYLSPAYTPGWAAQIGGRPWQTLERIAGASTVISFADALLVWDGQYVSNNVLIDPPRIYAGNHRWETNPHPTQSFRHAGASSSVFVDGHAAALRARVPLAWPEIGVGALTADDDPFYVPDWRNW